jgi:methionyl-tRNA formyltransferase
MDEGLDTGPVALQRKVPIPPDMTGGELAARLAELGSEALVEVLGSIEARTLTLTEQDSHNATYAAKLSDEDQVIRWDRRASDIHDQVRALAPRIGARTYHERVDGPVKIWRSRVAEGVGGDLKIGEICSQNSRMFVGCGEGVLEVLELQVPGARRVSVRDFLLGNTLDGGFSG